MEWCPLSPRTALSTMLHAASNCGELYSITSRAARVRVCLRFAPRTGGRPRSGACQSSRAMQSAALPYFPPRQTSRELLIACSRSEKFGSRSEPDRDPVDALIRVNTGDVHFSAGQACFDEAAKQVRAEMHLAAEARRHDRIWISQTLARAARRSRRAIRKRVDEPLRSLLNVVCRRCKGSVGRRQNVSSPGSGASRRTCTGIAAVRTE